MLGKELKALLLRVLWAYTKFTFSCCVTQKSCQVVLPRESWRKSKLSVLPLHDYCNLLNCDLNVSTSFPSFLAVAVREMISHEAGP